MEGFLGSSEKDRADTPGGPAGNGGLDREKENITRSECIEKRHAVLHRRERKAGSARSDDTGVSGNGRNQYHDFGGLFFCGTGALVYKGINFNVKRS